MTVASHYGAHEISKCFIQRIQYERQRLFMLNVQITFVGQEISAIL